MRKNGQITVFLSLILVCVCALLLGILESARTAGARCYLRIAADSALDSVFSQYHRQLWDQYRILALEYENTEEIEQRFEMWLSPYLEENNFYPIQLQKLEGTSAEKMTDDSGGHLEKEILQYMKYGIWKTDITADTAEDMYEKIRESETMNELSELYNGHAREAVRLEESLEAVAQCLRTQEERYHTGEEELYAEDGPAFRREAGRIIKELNRIPGLVREYEKKANALDRSLAESRKQFIEKQDTMSPAMIEAMNQEISRYEEYTAKDGSRRLEVQALPELAAANKTLVQETIEEALRVEEIIEEWEPENEDDELDTAALWAPVLNHFHGFQRKRLSFEPGVKDKEKQRLLEQVKKMMDIDLVRLVLPKGTEISKGVLDLTVSPSVTELQKQDEDTILDGIAGRAKGILVDEYCIQFFHDFLTPEAKEVQYETEYLIGEKTTDEGNLKSVVTKILEIRTGINLAWLLSNPQKRQEADALAAMIAGVVGAAPLTAVISFFILSVWALGEAANDVKTLMHGGKVPLWKSEADWKLSLDQLLQMGREGSVATGSSQEHGMSYPAYLKLLLFMKDPKEKLYRIMDIMQMNIRRGQPDFLMNHCAYSVDMTVQNRGKHLFFAVSLWKSVMGGAETGYSMPVRVGKAY